MTRNTWRRGTCTGRRIMMILAGLLLAAGAVAVWVLLVSEYGIGISLAIVGCLVLLCLGLLLGASWTSQTHLPERRQLAAERRRLNEEWAAVRTARQQRLHCPRCAGPLLEQGWFSAPTQSDEHQVLDAMPTGRA